MLWHGPIEPILAQPPHGRTKDPSAILAHQRSPEPTSPTIGDLSSEGGEYRLGVSGCLDSQLNGGPITGGN